MNSLWEHPLVERAARRCNTAHAGQTRDNGLPYSTHPRAVAQCLMQHDVRDVDVLSAALLHDVLEDTPTKAVELEAEFGPTVAALVVELTNPGPPDRPFADKHAALLAHARRMSPGARLVKLADRIHNLGEMAAWPAWKQARYARAALELADALEPSPSVALSTELRAAALAALRRTESLETAPMTPRVIAPDESRRLNILGVEHVLLVEGRDSGGATLFLRVRLPPGGGIPTHTHTREDEVFYVLEGQVQIHVGTQSVNAAAGAAVYGPRHVPHGYRAPPDRGAAMLVSVVPAGIESMFDELARLPAAPPDMARIAQIVGRYGISFA